MPFNLDSKTGGEKFGPSPFEKGKKAYYDSKNGAQVENPYNKMSDPNLFDDWVAGFVTAQSQSENLSEMEE